MRIEKREDGWWITGVTPYRVDDVVHDAYGPYATKAAAQDDLEGLTSFFEQHPELTSAPPLLEVGNVEERQYTAHWFVKSLAYRPAMPRCPRSVKSSPGQRRLPGME